MEHVVHEFTGERADACLDAFAAGCMVEGTAIEGDWSARLGMSEQEQLWCAALLACLIRGYMAASPRLRANLLFVGAVHAMPDDGRNDFLAVMARKVAKHASQSSDRRHPSL